MSKAFVSSTVGVPSVNGVPRHIAIIMDGNGRWAKARMWPRFAGHKRGVDAVRATVRACVERGVDFLTLFAFSSENWRRPAEEVSLLMKLFCSVLDKDVQTLHKQGIRLKVVGDTSAFDDELQSLIAKAHALTEHNTGMTLTICANYGGRWDILNATRELLKAQPHLAQDPDRINEAALTPHLSMSYAPEPELFIRTGGEQRISNFLVWQLAYTELYFTDRFWPDFGRQALDEAIESYKNRERRFGRTSEQVQTGQSSKDAVLHTNLNTPC